MWYANNLCPYMRRLTLILAAIFIGIPSVLFGMAEVLVMVVKGRDVLNVWINSGSGIFAIYSALCAVFGLLTWAAGILYGFGYSILYLVGKISKYLETNQSFTSWQYERAKRAMDHEPNIFIVWCKARHDQICPMVQFVGEKPNEDQ